MFPASWTITEIIEYNFINLNAIFNVLPELVNLI